MAQDEHGEVKAWMLNEDHFDKALRYFKSQRVRIQATACDMGMHTEVGIRAHQRLQVQKLISLQNATISGAQKVHLDGLIALAEGLSIPDYAQLQMLTEFLHDVTRRQLLGSAIFDPQDLSEFHWFVDAKAASRNRMETLWTNIFLPLLQAKSIREPNIAIEGGDYSHLPEGIQISLPEAPAHLAPYMERPIDRFEAFNIEMLFRSLTFEDSSSLVGLRMADVAANLVRRTLIGRLRKSGWRRLPSLMLPPLPPTQELIQMISYGNPENPWPSAPDYYKVLRELRPQKSVGE